MWFEIRNLITLIRLVWDWLTSCKQTMAQMWVSSVLHLTKLPKFLSSTKTWYEIDTQLSHFHTLFSSYVPSSISVMKNMNPLHVINEYTRDTLIQFHKQKHFGLSYQSNGCVFLHKNKRSMWSRLWQWHEDVTIIFLKQLLQLPKMLPKKYLNGICEDTSSYNPNLLMLSNNLSFNI